MRSRYLKPGFWKNEELAECRFESRLLFQGLWGLADWCGRLEKRPKRIKGEIFPYDNVDIEECLNELEKHGFIMTYGQGKYLWIINFEKHQSCHKNEKSTPSVYPCPIKAGMSTVLVPSEDRPNTVIGHPGNDSGNPVNCELNTVNCELDTVSGSTVQELFSSNDVVVAKKKSQEDETRSSIKKTYIEKYNVLAQKRGWFTVDPSKKIPQRVNDLLTKFLEDPAKVAMMDDYMAKLEKLDWAEAQRIEFTLRAQTFEKCMSGEWGPRAASGGFHKEPEKKSQSYNEMIYEKCLAEQIAEQEEIMRKRALANGQ